MSARGARTWPRLALGQRHRDTRRWGYPRDLGSARPLSRAGDAAAQEPPVLGRGASVHLWGHRPPLSHPWVPLGSPPNLAGAQPSPFIPASGVRHGKQTETHPKRNSWRRATLQLPAPAQPGIFQMSRQKAAGPPGSGGSAPAGGWDGKGCGRGGRDTRHPRSCRCHPRGEVRAGGGAGSRAGWEGGKRLHLSVDAVEAREDD